MAYNTCTSADHFVFPTRRKMAEKEEKAEPSNDDDDLDALLDSALEDFDKKPSQSPTTSKCCNTAKDSCATDNTAPKLNNFGFNESDIEAAAEEFEKSMKAMLGDDEELLKQWNEFTEKAASFKPEAAGSEPESAEAFEAHLLKTMKDMADNAKEMTNPPEFDESFFKAMTDMNVDGKEPDLNNGVFPMMQGMMMNLLSKDVLYPALDDLRTKYPPWLKGKKDSLKSDVYENYSQQYKLVCEICSEYEKEKEKDSEETKKKRFDRLMGLMQKMQTYGQPPQDLVGDKSAGFGIEGKTEDGFPPNKCPVM